MDTFKDLFQEIKDRIRNPFLSSFAISWLFFNWRITVTLIFYNEEILKRSGYNTYNNLIDARQDNCKMLIFPFVSACIYVFAFPYARNWINEFLAKRKMENDNKILENRRKASVKLERYIDLLRELEDQQKLVGTIYSEQKKDLEKLTSIQAKLVTEQQKIIDLQDQLNDSKRDNQILKHQITEPYILNGHWTVNTTTVDQYGDKWYVSDNEIRLPDDREFKIREFLHNPSLKLLRFNIYNVIRTPAGPSSYFVNEEYFESFEMKYDEKGNFFSDDRKAFSLKKLNL